MTFSLSVEPLESRDPVAGISPTPAEQVFLERLNDARSDPAAYGRAIGLDLAYIRPSQPLAWSPSLTAAARAHAQDMNDRRYFAHNSPDGRLPGDRITAAGYAWSSYGESLAVGRSDPDELLSLLVVDLGIPSLGHRRHLLADGDIYRTQRQAGVGLVSGSGPYRHYLAVETATPFPDSGPFVVGVVYDDTNSSGRYDAGEGLDGVTVTVAGRVWSTNAAGGYAVQLPAGVWTVSAMSRTETVAVRTDNVRIDFVVPSVDYTPLVRHLYVHALGRPASPDEAAAWAQVARVSGPRAAVHGIDRSVEALTRRVTSWYVSYLRRTPAGGESAYWVNLLARGLSEEHALTGVLSSAEYQSRGDLTTSLFVDFLSRSPDPTEAAAFRAAFDLSRAALTVLHSREYRTSVVGQYYDQHLGRPASDAEASAWALSPLDLATIRAAILSSPESVTRTP